MEGPPLGPAGEDITWPDQVAPRGRKASSTRKIKPQTSNRFTRVFPCNKKITNEQTVKMLVKQWFEPYGAPKQVHSDEDVRIRSDTGWYKRVLNALNVEVATGVPYTHTSDPLFERQKRVVEQNLRILMKQERTKDSVRLVPWAVLTMNSQRNSSTALTPHELFHGGRPAWFFKTPFPEAFKSPVRDWLTRLGLT